MARKKLCSCGSLGRKRTYKKRRRLGNSPTSPYHHKTESPGAVGRHRLHGLGAVKACKTWITKAGVRMRGCYTKKGFRITGRA